jgi:hypothetical protein
VPDAAVAGLAAAGPPFDGAITCQQTDRARMAGGRGPCAIAQITVHGAAAQAASV